MSAERKLHTMDEAACEAEAPLEPFALKQQVAERLAAHRARRGGSSSNTATTPAAAPRERTARIAAAVAERYAQSKSYRAFLAEEAERAVREADAIARQAEAAAEIAARNAEAVAQVQYDLLAELNEYDSEAAPALVPPPDEAPHRPARTHHTAAAQAAAQLEFVPEPSFTAADLTVRLADEIRLHAPTPAAHRARRTSAPGPAHEPIEDTAPDLADPSEALFLDEEIAFRQAPIFEPVEPPVEIPANLIEFPRQLVASRRARPRLAEGPLREESELDHDPTQLRIFEVEAEQISSAPAAESSAPEWTSILLDAHPRALQSDPEAANYHHAYASHSYAPAYQADEYGAAASPAAAQHLHRTPETQHLYANPFQVAPLQLRLMSATVDAIAVLAGFLVFTGAFGLAVSRFLPGGLHMSLQTAGMSAAGIIVLLGALYQYVFFTFSDATPGMRYARIGLCTFSDDNPTREAMRRRIFAVALSVAPLGIGLIWSLLDEDRLSWHDRISRMYQRSY